MSFSYNSAPSTPNSSTSMAYETVRLTLWAVLKLASRSLSLIGITIESSRSNLDADFDDDDDEERFCCCCSANDITRRLDLFVDDADLGFSAVDVTTGWWFVSWLLFDSCIVASCLFSLLLISRRLDGVDVVIWWSMSVVDCCNLSSMISSMLSLVVSMPAAAGADVDVFAPAPVDDACPPVSFIIRF